MLFIAASALGALVADRLPPVDVGLLAAFRGVASPRHGPCSRP
jgi:hypothetical protein